MKINQFIPALFLLFCLTVPKARAQDPQFTQIYASPMFLNPAFAGNHDYDCRKLPASRFKTSVAYRTQYNTDFNTLYGSVDYREKSGRLGIGGIIIRDRQGTVPLYNTQMGLIGSYKLPIINDWQVHFGLQANFNYRNVDFSQYNFPDQFSQSGLTSGTNEPLANASNRSYIDFAGGLLIFDDRFFGGVAAHHINQPNQSLFNGGTDALPMKVGIHTGYKFMFKKVKGFGRKRGPERSLTPTIHYKVQGLFQQLEAGTFFNYDPLILGAWYRGIPVLVKTPSNALNHEALCLMIATKVPTDYGLIRLGFSYDFPVSSQINAFGRTFELTMSYQLINEKCRKRIIYKNIPCPGL